MTYAPPHTMHLRDRDGEDRADDWQILFGGWGTYDTHPGPSKLLYGLDNWLCGAVGYAGFQGRITGESFRFGQGISRFKLALGQQHIRYVMIEPKRPKQVVRKFEFIKGPAHTAPIIMAVTLELTSVED